MLLGEDDFIRCCQVFLVHGSAGSVEQKAAHNQLLLFQQLPTAWQVALQVLCRPTAVGIGANPTPEAAMFISAQLVRHAVPLLTEPDQIQVRDRLLCFLQHTTASGVRRSSNVTPVDRLVCLGLASAVVHIKSGWSSWKEQLQVALVGNTGDSNVGLQLLLEVLAGIPGEVYGTCSAAALHGLDVMPHLQAMVDQFQSQKQHVMQLVLETLRSAPDAAIFALTVLQNWGRDTMPFLCVEFGLHCLDLHDGGLIGPLMDYVVSVEKPDLSQLATEIICDAFAHATSRSSSTASVEGARSEAVLVVRLAKQILSTRSNLTSLLASWSTIDDPDDSQVVVARNLSKIATTVACGDSHCLFADGWCREVRRAEGCSDAFGLEFLQYLVSCTSFPVPSVVEPTLEFWYTVLDMHRRWKDVVGGFTSEAWADFVNAALPTIQEVVGLLLRRCQFPAHYIQTNKLQSDHPDVDDVRDLRRDIGDALLSLFSNWPSDNLTRPGSFVCLTHVVQMLQAASNIQELDALLFVLDYMVELFDLDDLEPSDPMYTAVLEVWQSAVHEFGRIPDHVLLLHGTARLISSLVLPIQFAATSYVTMATVLAKGLHYPAVCPSSAKALLRLSTTLVKRKVGLAVRGDCIQLLLATINQDSVHHILQSQETAYGDFLEALLRFGHNFPDSDYVLLVNHAFPRLVSSLQAMGGPSTAPHDVACVMYLLARGLRGIQNLSIRDAFLSQEWPLIAAIAAYHGSHPKVRDNAVEMFVSVIPSTANVETLVAIAHLSLGWHDQYAAPHALSCLSLLASSQPTLHPQVLDYLIVAFKSFCGKFNYIPNAASTRAALLDRFQHPTEDLALEATQFFLLLRQVLRSAPTLLCRGGDSTLLLDILHFCCDVVAVDHKLPDVTDAVCGFFSDLLAMDHDGPVEALLHRIAYAWVESLLVFVAISTISTKTRCVSNVFHQALHAGQADSSLRDAFGAALQQVLVQRQLFQQQMTAADAHLLTQSMLGVKDRRKFQVLLNTTSMYLQGYGPPPWSAVSSPLMSPRGGAAASSFLDVLH
ncbi:hypothetical protein H310_01549 [Aphanomyces invadans]|uniref:Exportin-1/Importin-beta-like domain-containing protein n=1 Tax=Aphanomyces invadans TaxID=157072 RepID=A0A024URL5_9STRA|nr:hypothetical protein H310_01549 [Aphanomyces invadans]ETW09091.1 hypothetical protein H310_01549 [Aphanomyces invadans]|eukprot:XP_008862896.1 hypothetical protein H310_01549 [Aphanomyces invadans]